MTSFQYKVVGVSVEIEPRVTYEGDIVMKLAVEVSNVGADKNIAGQNLPSFGTRKATTRLRLRDGESNLLAGLLQESERKALRGSGRHPRAAPQAALLVERQPDRADGHRHAAHAAHRADARTHAGVTWSPSTSARSRTSASAGPPPLIAPTERKPRRPPPARQPRPRRPGRTRAAGPRNGGARAAGKHHDPGDSAGQFADPGHGRRARDASRPGGRASASRTAPT